MIKLYLTSTTIITTKNKHSKLPRPNRGFDTSFNPSAAISYITE